MPSRSQQAVPLAAQYRQGAVDFSMALDAQREMNLYKIATASAEQAVWLAALSSLSALGGEWLPEASKAAGSLPGETDVPVKLRLLVQAPQGGGCSARFRAVSVERNVIPYLL